MSDFDLLVIGGGPAGQKAAIQAAKLGKRAAVVECRQIGGVCVITGTIPSKTFREAVLHLTGYSQRGFYGDSYRVKQQITMDDLRARASRSSGGKSTSSATSSARNGVTLLDGKARFLDPHTIAVTGRPAATSAERRAVVIAVGTRPARPVSVEFDGRTILDSDGLLDLSGCRARWSWSAPG